jgi:hypothetical protein
VASESGAEEVAVEGDIAPGEDAEPALGQPEGEVLEDFALGASVFLQKLKGEAVLGQRLGLGNPIGMGADEADKRLAIAAIHGGDAQEGVALGIEAAGLGIYDDKTGLHADLLARRARKAAKNEAAVMRGDCFSRNRRNKAADSEAVV